MWPKPKHSTLEGISRLPGWRKEKQTAPSPTETVMGLCSLTVAVTEAGDCFWAGGLTCIC